MSPYILLVMILEIGRGEVIILPVMEYTDIEWGYYDCISDRDELSKKNKVPMACIKEGEA